MISFNFNLPTQVVHGEGVVLAYGEKLKKFGEKALIIAGEQSYIASGAVADVRKVLGNAGIEFQVFDQGESNPSLAIVELGVKMANDFKPDFLIGIGGGSAIDITKGVAVLAANGGDILSPDSISKALPMVVIPTTAGSGSEVTCDLVLADLDLGTKYKLGSKYFFPRIAFLDPNYIRSLPLTILRDTGVMALSNLVQAYLATESSYVSRLFVGPGIKLWADSINSLRTGEISQLERTNMQIAACLGGMAIVHTEPQVIDVLSYLLTYHHHVPHGRANGFVLGEYLAYGEAKGDPRVQEILSWLGLKTVAELEALLREILPTRITLAKTQINEYAAAAADLLGEAVEDVCYRVLHNSLGV